MPKGKKPANSKSRSPPEKEKAEKKPAASTRAKQSPSKPPSSKKAAAAPKPPLSTDSPKSSPQKRTVAVKKATKKKVKKEALKEEPLEKLLKAGEIAIKVKALLRDMVKVGASVLKICETGEAKIIELGGKWAFPLNVSINNIAAHYSSPPGDDLVIQKGDIVKVDCGVHVDGYVADTAFTVSFGEGHSDLIKASEEATKAAVDMIRPGITTDRLGEEIEETIRSYGFRPIRQLSGHELEQNVLHGSITIPNIKGTKGVKLREGQVFAIETFATTGTGNIHEDNSKCFIYQLIPTPVPVRLDASRRARKVILANYKDFPFTIRWIAKKLSVPTTKLALKDLSEKGQIRKHPALCDEKGSFISQSEHTVYLTGNSRIVTTRPKQ